MTATVHTGAPLSTETAARIAEGVEAVTGHGGAVEAHPLAGQPAVSGEAVTGSAVPVQPVPANPGEHPTSQPPAPAPAPAPAAPNVSVTVNPSK